MNKNLRRLLMSIRLDPALYREVAEDASANRQAVATVLLSSAAAGLANLFSGEWFAPWLNMAVALGGWYLWAFITYAIGTRLLPQPQTRRDPAMLLRCVGFASAPGCLQAFGIIPGTGIFFRLFASLWMLAAFVVAVRQALDYDNTWRAVGVCLLGWLLLMAVYVILFVISVGA